MLFIADNLATLEYKLQEEVMTVIQALGSVVSTCTPLVSVLEKAQVEGSPTDSIEGKRVILGDVSGKGTLESELMFRLMAMGAKPISSSMPVSWSALRCSRRTICFTRTACRKSEWTRQGGLQLTGKQMSQAHCGEEVGPR